MNSSMNDAVSNATSVATASNCGDADAVLTPEAGMPFQPPLGDVSSTDPFSEWLSLMEVVQMLCPEWPVRDNPTRGDYWRL